MGEPHLIVHECRPDQPTCINRDPTTADLVAALREAGVGEVLQSFTMQQRVTLALSDNAKPGRYLVVRIEGET